METSNDMAMDIKSMKLYSHIERFYNELKELGYDPEDRSTVLPVHVTNKFDQLHYYGTTTIDQAIAEIPISSKSRVLDIGSGLGGPARYMAHTTGCHVTALELQPDVDEVAKDLTSRCQLESRVTHLCGDFMKIDLETVEKADVMTCWMVFNHIADRDLLYHHCYECLTPPGKMYVEDIFRLGPLTAEEHETLATSLFCPVLPNQQELVQGLEKAGFTNVQFQDVTESWKEFLHTRVVSHRAARERYVRVHGERIYLEQDRFFSAVANMLLGGHVGGCKIMAEKK